MDLNKLMKGAIMGAVLTGLAACASTQTPVVKTPPPAIRTHVTIGETRVFTLKENNKVLTVYQGNNYTISEPCNDNLFIRTAKDYAPSCFLSIEDNDIGSWKGYYNFDCKDEVNAIVKASNPHTTECKLLIINRDENTEHFFKKVDTFYRGLADKVLGYPK